MKLPSREGLIRRAVEENGLSAFMRIFWSQVEPSAFSENWHHELMCKYLEKLARREIRELSIWVPPGSTKTLLTGVFLLPWIWTFDPGRRQIHTTYGGNLALKAARMQRGLVNSDLFQACWPGVKIPHQNTHAAAWFENNCKGSRFSGSVGGEVTGRHAHDLIGDDLNKAIDAIATTPLAFENAWAFWAEILPTRQAEPALTTRLQIGQRLHRDDVGGRWVASKPDLDVLCLPMRYEADHPFVHPEDPRGDGELMWPERFDEEAVQKLEESLGPSAGAAQLQQRPIPPGGQLLIDEYLSHRYNLPPASVQRPLVTGRAEPGQTWAIYGDLAFKGEVTSDYVVFQLWCAEEGELWLLDQIRGQWGFRETKERGKDFANRYPVASAMKLEDAANAPAMVDDMKGEIRGLQLIPHGGGCLARTQQSEGTWASGCVHLPANALWMGGSDGFVAEHLCYDGLGTRHDDQVSCSSLAITDLALGKASEYARIWRSLK